MKTEYAQMNTAYLDGVLMSLDGDKVVIITYGTQQARFYITRQGDVHRCAEQGPATGQESDFELYRMSFLEALIGGGSLIIRQIGVSTLTLPEALGGKAVPVDYLRGAEVGPKGIRGLKGEELKALYASGSDGAVEYHDFPSKDQVRITLTRQLEEEGSDSGTSC